MVKGLNTAGISVKAFVRFIISVLKILGFMILISIPSAMLLFFLGYQDKLSNSVNAILGFIVFVLEIIVILFLWKRYYKYSKESIRNVGWRDIGFVFLYLALARAFFEGGTFLINWVYGETMTANDAEIMDVLVNEKMFITYNVLLILSLTILSPIMEELIFRGIATNLLFKKNAFWLPLIILSTIFALLHGPTNIISFFMYGSLGVFFFLAYFRRRSILDAILVHILNNIVALIFLFISF